MENIDYTKLSSKGQIVVPKSIREYLNLKSGEIFMIFADNDTLILKRVKSPSKSELKKMFEKTQKLAMEKGIKPEDIDEAIQAARNETDI